MPFIALSEFDEGMGFAVGIARSRRDRRHASWVLHNVKQIFIHRLYGDVAG